MEDRLEILQKVLPAGLLGASVSSVASLLGYKGRATLYRIVSGEASGKAVAGVYDKIEDVMYLGEDALRQMADAVDNTAWFTRLMRAETDEFGRMSATEVVKAFVFHDYRAFSDRFRTTELVKIQRMEHADPDGFFAMLGYFYVKSLRLDFYAGPKSHDERCAAIMEPLGRQLMEVCPANGIAAATVTIYSRSRLLATEVPVLWSFLSTLATMLQYYATPDLGKIIAKQMYLVPFLDERTYWKSADGRKLMLMRDRKNNVAGSGFYEVFSIDVAEDSVECIGVMTFLSDGVLTYRNKRTGIAELGCYEVGEEGPVFMWENESPLGLGEGWTRVATEMSQSLRVIDRYLTDEKLSEAALVAEGYEPVAGWEVENVTMSRSGVRLSLKTGEVYEISYSEAPFMEYILPTNDVIIGRRLSDGEVFVSWPQLMHCIPLRLFKKIAGE